MATAKDKLTSRTKSYFLVDFVYTENGQQFGTGAFLTPKQAEMLDDYLQRLCADGYISDPQVHKPGDPVRQGYYQAIDEIERALGL